MASYTEVTISDYNFSAPSDDGSTATANKVLWATIKTKLGDPINTAISSVNTNVVAAGGSLDTSVTNAGTSITSINSSLTTAQTALYAPATTAMLFLQTAAPTLWTKITSLDDYALRLVSGTASTGGSTAFSSIFTSRTLTTAELPSHDHSFTSASNSISFARSTWSTGRDTDTTNLDSGGASRVNAVNTTTQAVSGVSASVTLAGTTTSTGSGSAIDFAIQYVDFILATKD